MRTFLTFSTFRFQRSPAQRVWLDVRLELVENIAVRLFVFQRLNKHFFSLVRELLMHLLPNTARRKQNKRKIFTLTKQNYVFVEPYVMLNISTFNPSSKCCFPNATKSHLLWRTNNHSRKPSYKKAPRLHHDCSSLLKMITMMYSISSNIDIHIKVIIELFDLFV